MSAPVTVSVTRHVDPADEAQMLAWLRAGTDLVSGFEGFLGSGWVRPGRDSTAWHVLFRFQTQDDLDVWLGSAQRDWWLSSARGFVDESRLERRTGIEGWFDDPADVDVQDLRTPPAAPPRWKQMISIFVVFWPLSLVANTVATRLLGDVPLAVRVTATVLVMTPLMTYVFLPWITGLLSGWLNAPRASASASGRDDGRGRGTAPGS